MNIKDLIKQNATLAQAHEWQTRSEQYLYCVDLLGCWNMRGTEHQVNALEDRFSELLHREQVENDPTTFEELFS